MPDRTGQSNPFRRRLIRRHFCWACDRWTILEHRSHAARPFENLLHDRRRA